MLKFDLRRAGASGWFKPRKDGPLITGSEAPVGAAAGGVALTAVGTGVAAATDSAVLRDTEAGFCPTAAAAVAGACSKVAPHIPQKRFATGFSLPHRAQRTAPS